MKSTTLLLLQIRWWSAKRLIEISTSFLSSSDSLLNEIALFISFSLASVIFFRNINCKQEEYINSSSLPMPMSSLTFLSSEKSSFVVLTSFAEPAWYSASFTFFALECPIHDSGVRFPCCSFVIFKLHGRDTISSWVLLAVLILSFFSSMLHWLVSFAPETFIRIRDFLTFWTEV